MATFFHQLNQVTELISLPEIYHQIRDLMTDPTADIHDFARIIRLDANLSAKLLRLVNSAYYGLSDPVDDISRAVNLLGTQQLYNMVLGLSVVSSLSPQQIPADITDVKSLWRSNLLCGNLSQLLAEQLKIKPADRLFIVGLLHNIGHMVLYANFPDLARQAIDRAEQQNLTIHEAELQIQGCHYGDIGAMLMELWQLPEDFQQLVRYQPTPSLAPENWVETALLHIAHAYACSHFQLTRLEFDNNIEAYAWDITRLDPAQVETLLEQALSITTDMESAIIR